MIILRFMTILSIILKIFFKFRTLKHTNENYINDPAFSRNTRNMRMLK
jgi:hypothetical protein